MPSGNKQYLWNHHLVYEISPECVSLISQKVHDFKKDSGFFICSHLVDLVGTMAIFFSFADHQAQPRFLSKISLKFWSLYLI